MSLLHRAYEIGVNEGIFELASSVRGFVWRQFRKRIHRGVFKDELNLECNGINVTFDTSNSSSKWWFYPRYLGGKLHEPALTRELIDVLEPDSVFFDIGANIGYFTLFASEMCVDGEVHSFDMHEKHIKAIDSNLNRNGTTAHLIKKAVSDESYNSIHTNLTQNGCIVNARNQFESIALDDYAKDHSLPSVMKIDVEGFEYNVLKGSVEIFQKDKPETLFIEVHPQKLQYHNHTVSEVISFLDHYGYNVRKFIDHRSDSVDVSELDADEVYENTMLKCTK
uniref:FkbM family methyltransferase n=1 Tax=Haloquadratum walsbyi TaxID=293091 RepID=A0A445MQG3_9EURY|nr:FkbM family methyltransferase [Haloquadratum walsbyi]SPC48769.1 FkbM family methyltransferase [Haloquadratum walsbyi]